MLVAMLAYIYASMHAPQLIEHTSLNPLILDQVQASTYYLAFLEGCVKLCVFPCTWYLESCIDMTQCLVGWSVQFLMINVS